MEKLSDRYSFVFFDRGRLAMKNGQVVLFCKSGTFAIPIGDFACVFLEPGTSLTHEVVKEFVRQKVLGLFVSANGSSVYSTFGYNEENPEKIMRQCFLSNFRQLEVCRLLFRERFGLEIPVHRSVNSIMGIEGNKMKKTYQELSSKYGVEFNGRENNVNKKWEELSRINKFLNVGNACLYGVVEAAIRTYGCSISVGFFHRGRPRSLVYDIADVFKVELVTEYIFSEFLSFRDERDVKSSIRERLENKKIFKRVFSLLKLFIEDDDLFEPKGRLVGYPN